MARFASFPKIEGGYFLVPNAYFDDTAELSHAEFRLLISVCRFTFGWLKPEAAIAHPLLTERTGLHQTSIRRGMLRLQEEGYVRVGKRMIRGRELNVFEPVLPLARAEEGTAASESTTPCVVHGDPMHHACHAKTVPSNEGKEKQQQAEPFEPKPTPPNPTPHPAAVPSEDDLTEEQAALLARMRRVGVGRTVALRLLGSCPAEIVAEALDNLPHRNARRPAALLVRELQEGGWELPREAVQEQKKPEVEDSRRAEEQAQVERERQEAAVAEGRFQVTWDALSAERRSLALEEARQRVAWAAHLPGALEEGSPILAGALREVVGEWAEVPVAADLDEGAREAAEASKTPARREATVVVVPEAATVRRAPRSRPGFRRPPFEAATGGASGSRIVAEVRC